MVFVDGGVTLRDTATSATDIQYMNTDSTGKPVPRTCTDVKINPNTLENDALRCSPKRQTMIMNTAFEEKAEIQTTKLNEIDQKRTHVDHRMPGRQLGEIR